MADETPTETTGPCFAAYETDLPDSDRLGPDYSAPEVPEMNETPAPNPPKETPA